MRIYKGVTFAVALFLFATGTQDSFAQADRHTRGLQKLALEVNFDAQEDKWLDLFEEHGHTEETIAEKVRASVESFGLGVVPVGRLQAINGRPMIIVDIEIRDKENLGNSDTKMYNYDFRVELKEDVDLNRRPPTTVRAITWFSAVRNGTVFDNDLDNFGETVSGRMREFMEPWFR